MSGKSYECVDAALVAWWDAQERLEKATTDLLNHPDDKELAEKYRKAVLDERGAEDLYEELVDEHDDDDDDDD